MAHYGCGLKYNDAVNLDGWMDQETTADGVLETVALTQASNPGIDQAGGEHARSHYVRPIAQKLLAAIYSGHSDVLSKAFSRLNDQFSIHVLMHDEESATNTNQSYLSPTPFYNRFPSLFLAEATLIGEPF